MLRNALKKSQSRLEVYDYVAEFLDRLKPENDAFDGEFDVAQELEKFADFRYFVGAYRGFLLVLAF